MAISVKIGPPVTGDDFYGRTAELKQAHGLLDTNNSIVLSAPRRIGKSSFAKRLIEDKKAQGWKCAYIDLEGIKNQQELLSNLIDQFNESKIWDKSIKSTGGFLRSILESIKGIGPVKLDFKHSNSVPTDIYQDFAKRINHSQDSLIVIDELPLFLGKIEKDTGSADDVSFILNWFRSLRQVSGSRIRWILCGSVGLHNFTRTRNLSMTINDLAELNFDEMSSEESYGLISALAAAESVKMNSDIIRMFLDKLSWHIPYFIQLLFFSIKSKACQGKAVTPEMIDESFDELVHSEHMSTWSERLAEYNGQESGARFILTTLAHSGDDGLSINQMLPVFLHASGMNDRIRAGYEIDTTLNMLEHDGYLMRKDDKRKFRSPLLKAWWKYKYSNI